MIKKMMKDKGGVKRMKRVKQVANWMRVDNL